MWTTIIGVALLPVALILRVTFNDACRTICQEIRDAYRARRGY